MVSMVWMVAMNELTRSLFACSIARCRAFVLLFAVVGCLGGDERQSEGEGAGTASTGGDSSTSGQTTASTEASAGTADGTGADETGGPPSGDCLDPMPIPQFDGVTPSGFVECSDGFRHRVEAVACVVPEAPATCEGRVCTTPADCAEGPHGACIDEGGGCGCVYSCETDADCGDTEICVCAGLTHSNRPRCVVADCVTTSDCGMGLCGLSKSTACPASYALACLTEASECRTSTCNDADPACACAVEQGEWRCFDECVCG